MKYRCKELLDEIPEELYKHPISDKIGYTSIGSDEAKKKEN